MEVVPFIAVLAILLVASAVFLRQQQVIVRVPARYESVRALTALLGRFMQSARLGEQEAFACRLALDEACVNIIEHAYANDPGGEIEMLIKAAPGHCTIRLTDYGHSYDPATLPPPQIGSNLESVRPGGLGLFLMQQVMDEVTYTAGPDGNSLSMTKRRA